MTPGAHPRRPAPPEYCAWAEDDAAWWRWVARRVEEPRLFAFWLAAVAVVGLLGLLVRP